jgi:hypothetical protein
MSDNGKKRDLEQNERQVMELINTWNRLCDEGKQVGTLTMTEEGAETLMRHGIAQPYKVESMNNGRIRMFFTLVEMEKYLYFAAKQVGFTLLLNGGVRTGDGLFVEPTPVNLSPNQVFS